MITTKPIIVWVSRKEYKDIHERRTYRCNVRYHRKYACMIPDRGFTLNGDEMLLAEGPTEVIFRQRWSLRMERRKIRQKLLVKDETGITIRLFFI